MLETSLLPYAQTGEELSRKCLSVDEQRRIYTHVKYKWKHISTRKSLAWSSGIHWHASVPKGLLFSGVSTWSHYASYQQIPFHSRMENKLGIKYIQY